MLLPRHHSNQFKPPGRFLQLAAGVIFLLGGLALPTPPVLADMNLRYSPDDWTAYTSVRYVHAAVETYDYVYFATRGGVARYDRFKGKWTTPLTTAEGLRDNSILRLAYDSLTDELFADTPLGPSVYRALSRQWYDTDDFPDSLTQPLRQVDMTRWTLPPGYTAFEADVLTDPWMRSYEVMGGLQDSENRWWITTWGQFIWTVDDASFEIQHDRWGLFAENVAAMYADSLQLCFGGPAFFGSESGFTVYDRDFDQWNYYEARFIEGFRSDYITRIVGETNGKDLWLGTDQGVVRFDRDNGEFRTFGIQEGLANEEVRGLFLDGEILWVGTEHGIDGIYLPEDSVFDATTDPIRGARVYDIDVTGSVVWIGTDRGLFRLIKPTPYWKRYSYADGPLAGKVRSLTHDADNLYIGSDRGIAIIDLKGLKPVRIYESPSILPDSDIFDLAVTDSILWAATRNGLLRFVPSTHQQRMFTTADGLLDDFVETIVVEGDYLWLGTIYGANKFRWNNPLRVD